MSLTRTNAQDRPGYGPVARTRDLPEALSLKAKAASGAEAPQRERELQSFQTRDDGICKASIYVDYITSLGGAPPTQTPSSLITSHSHTYITKNHVYLLQGRIQVERRVCR
jgi:hypothetical protein